MRLDSPFRLFSVFVLVLALMGTAARAQTEQSVPVVSPEAPPQQDIIQSLPPDTSEVTILRDDYAGKYHTSTLENLSKLYWRLGAFDMEDELALGNFLKINECKLYTDYINDDMEWKEILETMKSHITMKRDTYPLNFQFVLPLHLGRYDAAQGGFPIVDKTDFKNSKRIEVSSIDMQRSICFDRKPIKDYPTSLVILLLEPFTLEFLKLDEHVAQAYILRKKSEYSQLDESRRLKQYERDAYLRLRVTFSQYHGNLAGTANTAMAILYGRIDGYEIFEDSTQKRLMLSIDLKKQQISGAPQMSTPAQPMVDTVVTPNQNAVVPTTAPTTNGFAATP